MSVAKSIAGLVPFWQIRKVKLVLDYGAGNMRNSLYLFRKGFRVIPVERSPHWRQYAQSQGLDYVFDPMGLPESLIVDLVLLNFVLNIIPDDLEKRKILHLVWRIIKPEGYLLVEVANNGKFMASGGEWLQNIRRYIPNRNIRTITQIETPSSIAILFQKNQP